jgi:hypothetical protein
MIVFMLAAAHLALFLDLVRGEYRGFYVTGAAFSFAALGAWIGDRYNDRMFEWCRLQAYRFRGWWSGR